MNSGIAGTRRLGKDGTDTLGDVTTSPTSKHYHHAIRCEYLHVRGFQKTGSSSGREGSPYPRNRTFGNSPWLDLDGKTIGKILAKRTRRRRSASPNWQPGSTSTRSARHRYYERSSKCPMTHRKNTKPGKRLLMERWTRNRYSRRIQEQSSRSHLETRTWTDLFWVRNSKNEQN